MPHTCCVPSCKGNRGKGPRVSVFSFPKDPQDQLNWIKAIKRGDLFVPTKTSRVCELHFQPHEILRETSFTVAATGEKLTAPLLLPRLIKGAVPSLFPTFNESLVKKENPQEYSDCTQISENLSHNKNTFDGQTTQVVSKEPHQNRPRKKNETQKEKKKRRPVPEVIPEYIANDCVEVSPNVEQMPVNRKSEEQILTFPDEHFLKSSHNLKINEELEVCDIKERGFVGITSASFSKICRTCLAHSELISISDFIWEGVPLQEVIQNWTSLVIKEDDQLPKQLCKCCVKQIYNMYNFLVKCKTTESILNSILDKERSENHAIPFETPVDPFELHVNAAEILRYNQATENINSNVSSTKTSSEAFSTIKIKSENPCNDDQEEQNLNLSTEIILMDETQNVKNECVTSLANPGINELDESEQVSHTKKFVIIKNDHAKVKGSIKRVQVSRKKYPINSCIPCDVSFVSAEKLRSHIYSEHRKEKMFICPYCPRKNKFSSRYIEHVRYHTGEIFKSCSVCGKGFCSALDLQRHMRIHSKTKPYVCKICKKGFQRSYLLSDHMRRHTGEKRVCPTCGAGFLSYTALYSHERSHQAVSSSEKEVRNSEDSRRCHICSKVMSSIYTLEQHLLHHGPKQFTCDICGKGQISEYKLTYHKQVSHSETKFKCNLCDKEYKQKNTLAYHMKWHEGLRNYVCNVCGKKYKDRGSYSQHLRKHTGDTKYQCTVCQLICVNKRNLDGHMRTHTGEKPYSCEYCGKLFAHYVNVKEHVMRHSGKNKVKCKFCHRYFYGQSRLRSHVKQRHKEQYSEEDFIKS